MKHFRIFAVGLILSAVIVSTALAPLGNAAANTQIQDFSDRLFIAPSLSFSSFVSITKDLNFSTTTTTTGPTSNPPEADVVPNFSGLIVEGPVSVDADDDGNDEFVIDEDGEVFVDERFEVNAGGAAGDTFAELDVIGYDSLKLGKYASGVGVVIDNFLTKQVYIDAYDASIDLGYFTVESPNILLTHAAGTADVQIEGDLNVTGAINSPNSIGSFYMASQNASAYSVSATCDSGDFLTGCSGYASTSAFKGAIPSGRTCTAYRSSSGSITAYAMCHDPAGIK